MSRAVPANQLFLAMGLATLVACSAPEPARGWDGWAQLPVRYAHFFQLWGHGENRLLLTFGPGGTTDTTGIFVLGGSNTPMPPGGVRLTHPLERVALLSTTHASFITALGRAAAVVGCAYSDRLRDPAVAARAHAGLVEEIGAAKGVDREKVLMLRPDALFTYPYDTDLSGLAMGNVTVVPVSEYLEVHPLGRAEWIRAFGVLFGVGHRADSLFQRIGERYGAALASVPPTGEKPFVFFGSAWKGSWSVPSGNSYMARLIEDAGGHYLFAANATDGNSEVALETVLQVGAKADYWGRILVQEKPVTAADVAGGDSRILGLSAFRNKGAFYGNSSESDLFGQAGLEPDVVLRDLICLFHPDQCNGRKPVYFKPVQ